MRSTWRVIPEPENGDPLDGDCPFCYQHQHQLVAEIIQFGIQWDKHIYLMVCENCHHQLATMIDMAFEEV